MPPFLPFAIYCTVFCVLMEWKKSFCLENVKIPLRLKLGLKRINILCIEIMFLTVLKPTNDFRQRLLLPRFTNSALYVYVFVLHGVWTRGKIYFPNKRIQRITGILCIFAQMSVKENLQNFTTLKHYAYAIYCLAENEPCFVFG